MNADSPSVRSTFIDTNIWLYAFNTSQDPHKTQRAKQIIRRTPHIVLSTQIVNEIASNLLRKFQANEPDIQKLIRSLYRKYGIVELDRRILLHASDLRGSYRFSFWDSLVVASALATGAGTLYTEDMHDGLIVSEQLTIRNPLKAVSNP